MKGGTMTTTQQKVSPLALHIRQHEKCGHVLPLYEIVAIVESYGPGDYETYPKYGYPVEHIMLIMEECEEATTIVGMKQFERVEDYQQLIQPQQQTYPGAKGYMVFMVYNGDDVKHVGIKAGSATSVENTTSTSRHTRNPLFYAMQKYDGKYAIVIDYGLSRQEAHNLQMRLARYVKQHNALLKKRIEMAKTYHTTH